MLGIPECHAELRVLNDLVRPTSPYNPDRQQLEEDPLIVLWSRDKVELCLRWLVLVRMLLVLRRKNAFKFCCLLSLSPSFARCALSVACDVPTRDFPTAGRVELLRRGGWAVNCT